MTDKIEKTALNTSVGADERQSIQKTTDSIIPTSNPKINDPSENSEESFEEMCRRMQRLTDPRYLHTITLTELFQTSYTSRPPIIEGLLYAGAQGHPKSVSPLWWLKSPTMLVPDRICGDIKSIREQFSTLRWKMIFSVSRAVCL